MSPLFIALLVFQGVVFLIWIFLGFRWLFALRADAVAESGATFVALGASLRAFRRGLVDGRYAKDRVRLGILTIALVGATLVQHLFLAVKNP
jgi:hypothetical protein